MIKPLAALAVLFLAAHLLYLPSTLEDIDSINFALGVRDFDVARHQPHPPGYPIFVALAKLATGVLDALGVGAAASRGLALLSAIAGALLVPLLFAFHRGLGADPRVAWWAMALAVCSPLFWFTALRPLSDTTGLAFAVAAQVLLAGALRGGRGVAPASPTRSGGPQIRAGAWLVGGALLCGLAAGVRIQTAVLTAPLLAAALLWPGRAVTIRERLAAAGACVAGVALWAVPLLVASGGPGAYLAALGTQAGEDLSGVVMLWTTRRARVAADAVLYTFVWPWGRFELGAIVIAIAAAGFVRAVLRAPRMLALLLLAFAPYAVFHLLFHETVTIRYALPLVIPVAGLAAYAAAGLGRAGLTVIATGLAAASLMVTVPATRAYAHAPSPAFQLFQRFAVEGGTAPGGGRADVIGMHAVMRRVEEWSQEPPGTRVIRARHGREWLALIDHWRNEPLTPVRFFADPRRTDLALFDPHARQLEASARWTFPELPFVAGTRPGAADVYTMRPPGWMLEHGWALTAEVGGVTAREGLGPHVQPSVAWVRARGEPASLIIGGRNLGGAADAAARLTLAGDRGAVDAWTAAPGFFFRHVQLPAGSLAGSGYVPLRLSAVAADGSGREARVAIEQFDLQSDGVVMLGLVDGWQEPEYDPATARSWRWMSERARVWVRPTGRDVTLTLAAESPLRYFDRAPAVRVMVAGVELARFTPGSDFVQDVAIPARGLALAGGLVTIETDLWFTPADRGQSADARHLALRVYDLRVR